MPKDGQRSLSLTSQESYSAVIIADLVAEVPISPTEAAIREANRVSKRRGSAPKSPKKIEKGTNFAYDGPMESEAGSPATVSVDSMETVHMRPSRANGTENGVSKGIILNATQISTPYDIKREGGQEMLSKTLSLKMNDVPEESKMQGVAGMSVLRKIAFGCSFLPSIMFVLCFAIILPCEEVEIPKPCVQEKWAITLNDTELTSQLNLPENLVFAYSNEDGNGVICLDRKNGSKRWQEITNSEVRYINCDLLDFNLDGINDCLVMEKAGNILVFNTSNGTVLWNHFVGVNLSLPIILPDCNQDGAAEIALAVSNTTIYVLYHGDTDDKVDVSGCKTVPSKLTRWTRTKTTDLVFYCQTEDGGSVIKSIPLSKWCVYDTELFYGIITLLESQESMEEAIILPTAEGLVVWFEDDVFMIEANGNQSWKVPSTNHSMERRFLKYGRFNGKGNQVALFSSDLQENMQVTTLNSSDGNVTWSWSAPNSGVSDVLLLSGEKKDFALVAILKMKTNFTKKAGSGLHGVTTTIFSLLSNDEINTTAYNESTAPTVIEKLVLMELDGKEPERSLHEKEILLSIDDERGILYPTVDLASNITGERLTIVAASTIESSSPRQAISTQLTAITVDKWDIPTSQASKCTW